MRRAIAVGIAFLFVLVSCSGSDGDSGGASDSSASSTDGINVCALLSDEEIVAAVGIAPESKPTEPSGPFTGCNWGTGFLFVQIAPAVTLITAPLEGESDCPSAGVGDESIVCFGGVKFLTNGIHASITTIENLTEAQMVAVARALLPKLQG